MNRTKIWLVPAVTLFGAIGVAGIWYGKQVIGRHVIGDIPTCVEINFTENRDAIQAFDLKLQRLLEESGIPAIPSSLPLNRSYLSSSVMVDWQYPTHGRPERSSKVSVCQWNRQGDEWEKVAKRVESELAGNYRIDSIDVLLNPAIFECNGNCRRKLSAPLDLSVLHEKPKG